MPSPRLIIAALALGAAVAEFLRRRRKASASSSDQREQWSCECGQRFRVAGTGRHRVYWLEGADHTDPVIGHDCPSCGRELPSGNDSRAHAVS